MLCLQNNTIANIKNIQLTSGPVRYSAVIPAAIPESAEKETYVVSNCTPIARKEKNSYSVTFEEGSDVTTTTSLKSSQNAQLNLKFSVIDFSVGAAREVNTSQEGKQSYRKTVTRSLEVDETVQPYTTLIIDIEQRLSNAYVDFDGDVRVESDYGVTKYSTVVPSNWTTIKGQIWNSSARSLVKSFREVRLDPATCGGSTLAKAAAGAQSTSSSKHAGSDPKIDDIKAFDRTGAQLNPMPTVSSYQPGMSVKTADLMSQIQVRLKSDDATPCVASFLANDVKTNLVATHEWSRWHNVAFSTKAAAVTLHNSSTCTSGITAEVRYIK